MEWQHLIDCSGMGVQSGPYRHSAIVSATKMPPLAPQTMDGSLRGNYTPDMNLWAGVRVVALLPFASRSPHGTRGEVPPSKTELHAVFVPMAVPANPGS